jgi:hypothetical protein
MQMKAKNVAAALLIAVGTSSALALAAPVFADPVDDQVADQQDQAFLKALGDQGVRMPTDREAIDLAHSTCAVLTRTGSVESALRHVQNATEWTDSKKIGAFGSFAVQAYCPKSMPKP